MNVFRNPEVSRGIKILSAISIVAVLAAFIWNITFGIFTLCLCIALVTVHTAITIRRYKKITALSRDIDKILHGNSEIIIERFTEGELGILQSEIHKMTVRLREQQYKLQSDKIYLADSLADISHQIKTPLTSINLLVSMICKPDITEKQRKVLIRELNNLLYRIDDLITVLLKISKLDAKTVEFKRETVSLQKLVDISVSTLLVPIELRNQTFNVTASGNFTGDLSWTAEAIGNIIKNCMEHTAEGGELKVHAVENPLFCEIIISDNGTGISEEDLPHIFERFYKGKNSGEQSFGIGLALARMIIRRQNGTVKAENNPKGGASFTVRFYKSGDIDI